MDHKRWDDCATGSRSNSYWFWKGFIRAQTISYQNLIDSGSISNAKNKGLLRSEGKEYIVNEGDVMEFLFNV